MRWTAQVGHQLHQLLTPGHLPSQPVNLPTLGRYTLLGTIAKGASDMVTSSSHRIISNSVLHTSNTTGMTQAMCRTN